MAIHRWGPLPGPARMHCRWMAHSQADRRHVVVGQSDARTSAVAICRGRIIMIPPWVSEVADGVFAYVQPDGSWWINNTGFVRGDRTVLSIDTCSTERRTQAYLSTVKEIAGEVPRTLVNAH